jgi:hypothetical protein
LATLSTRQLKKQVLELLRHPDFDICIDRILGFPLRKVVNPLFSFLYSLEEPVKWRAVSAMGAVVSEMALRQTEAARVVMRRFIWNLNDESGGIGWGSPESMGEAMAQNRLLAEEFTCILVSYVRPDMNFIEHEDLQKGVIWGLGRLAHARPGLADEAARFLPAYLDSTDAILRGLAVWTAGAFSLEYARERLEELSGDRSRFRLYRDNHLQEVCIADLAAEFLQRRPSRLPSR